MTISDFANAVVFMRKLRGGNVTRWGCTAKHSIAVGGFDGDPHTWDLGVDMIYDYGPNLMGSEDHPKHPYSCPHCSTQGLKLIHEETHDHLQPASFPAGPVKQYPV